MKPSEALQKTQDVIRLRHLARSTEECYLGWIKRFMGFVDRLDPTLASEAKVESFLTSLAKLGCSASTQNQAFNAILFLYREVLGRELNKIAAMRAQRPAMIRTAPEIDEVRALLGAVEDLHGYPTRLITRMLYGCGFRVTEPLNLRVKDVLLGESRLILRGAKGGKDRIVPLPCSLVPEIKLQLRHARLVWEKDFSGKIPVPLPGRLASKYPDWQHAWKWAWVFPSHTTCVDDRTGKVVRFRCHEANVQRAVKGAARKLGLCVTPHQLRHAYATHAVRSGSNVRDVQEALGHSQINTTMNYLTPRACAVPSPLEVL